MADTRSEYRRTVGAITTGLARYRDQVNVDGDCADGPDCLWCRAETIAQVLVEKGLIAGDTE